MLQIVQALAFALALLVSTAYSLVEDAAPALGVHPFTSCQAVGGIADCDPVNLIFPGKTWPEVRDALQADGWTTAGFGSRQQLRSGDAVSREDEQMFLADTPGSRYHIRLWQGAGLITYAAVHHEVENLHALTHTIDMDWEAAEAFVASTLCPIARGCPSTAVFAEQERIQSGDLE